VSGGYDPLSALHQALEDDTPVRSTSVAPPPRRPATAPTDPEGTDQATHDAGEGTGSATGTSTGDAVGEGSGPASAPPTAPAGRNGPSTSTRVPRQRTARPTEEAETPAENTSERRVPGYAQGNRRKIAICLTAPTAEALAAARGEGRSNGDVVIDALAATHEQITNERTREHAPTGLFPPSPRRRQRLDVNGVVRADFLCSPDQAQVIGQLADLCEMSVSALVERALQLAGIAPVPGDEPSPGT
jgi:hypothetical protein